MNPLEVKALFVALCALGLCSCAATGSGAADMAPANAPLGYPAFIGIRDGKCDYQVQDMIMIRRSDIAGWLRRLQDKSQQIDIVIESTATERAIRCAKDLSSVARDAGFTTVLVRDAEGLLYPPGGPPR